MGSRLSTIGAATAADIEILTWATEHGFVLITNDLDFPAILAASAGVSPGVVQVRSQDLLSDEAASIIAMALEAHREDVERGALAGLVVTAIQRASAGNTNAGAVFPPLSVALTFRRATASTWLQGSPSTVLPEPTATS